MVAVFRMSRSVKEKYENTNPRRNHVIMSHEEAATGKKSIWTELEITGTVDRRINNVHLKIHSI